MKVTLNLNDRCLVKLTAAGLDMHREFHRSLNIRSPYVAPRVDAKGRSEWPLWELFQVFGSKLHNGAIEMPFDKNKLEMIS